MKIIQVCLLKSKLLCQARSALVPYSLQQHQPQNVLLLKKKSNSDPVKGESPRFNKVLATQNSSA